VDHTNVAELWIYRKSTSIVTHQTLLALFSPNGG